MNNKKRSMVSRSKHTDTRTSINNSDSRSSWRNLNDIDERINALPKQCRKSVLDAHENKWSTTRLRNKSCKHALNRLLETGERLPECERKQLLAILRGVDKNRQLTKNPKNIAKNLENLPHLIIFLFSEYGITPFNEWVASRRSFQKNQKKWTAERENKAANLCKKIFGGLPSHCVLKKQDNRELKALSQHLGGKGKICRFAKKHGLKRILIKNLNGHWGTAEGIRLLKSAYAGLCLEYDRYIPDSELSMLEIEVNVGETRLAANTLRSYLKHMKCSKGTIRSVFEDLIKTGILPEKMLRPKSVRAAADGTLLDSWTEVVWYELFKRVHSNTAKGVLERPVSLVVHPYIGTSKRKSDFLIGERVYVEVLRYPLSLLRKPSTDDQKKYARLLNQRIKIYKKQKLIYLTIDAYQLNNDQIRSQHFSDIFKIVIGKSAVVPLITRICNPTGYWFVSENRMAAINETIELRNGKRGGVYPSHREMEKAGHGGLVSYYKSRSQAGSWDRQTEAVKCNTFATGCYTRALSDLRMPSRRECLKVLRHHHAVIHMTSKVGFAAFELRQLFGEKMYRHIVGEFGSIKGVAEAMGMKYIKMTRMSSTVDRVVADVKSIPNRISKQVDGSRARTGIVVRNSRKPQHIRSTSTMRSAASLCA